MGVLNAFCFEFLLFLFQIIQNSSSSQKLGRIEALYGCIRTFGAPLSCQKIC